MLADSRPLLTSFDGTGVLIARTRSISVCVCPRPLWPHCSLSLSPWHLSLSFFLSLFLLLCSHSHSRTLALSFISWMCKSQSHGVKHKSKREWETFSVVFLGFYSLASRFNLSLSSLSHSLVSVRAWLALVYVSVCLYDWISPDFFFAVIYLFIFHTNPRRIFVMVKDTTGDLNRNYFFFF